MALRKRKEIEIANTDSSENAIANKEVEGLSQRQIVLRRFLRHRAAMISLGILISLISFVFSASNFHIGKFG